VSLHTCLNVPALVNTLNATATATTTDVTAVVSKDPGRYVCNYTYFCSLDHCCRKSTDAPSNNPSCANYRCLFLHVPPFEVEGKEAQLAFLLRTLEAIKDQIVDEK
jgi:pyrrolidone-carboxylate peptidase